MRRALLAVLMVLVPLQAAALDRNELLGLVAMPLAVAAVSDATAVPAGDLGRFVSILNQAAVPPTQVVQVVRYAPVALVVEQDPPFVDYVSQQYYDGVTGPRLVHVIEDRYRTYDLEPEFVTLREPATTYVVRDDYVPPVVVTRVAEYRPLGYQPAGYPSYGYQPAYDTNDLLALAAMPLAVAAVSEIAGIPYNQLTGLMTSLNAARMPPVQVVEVLRYAPVALVADYGQPRFVPYIQTQVVSGLRGPALIEVIDTRLRSYDVEPRFLYDTRPERIVYTDDAFFPPVVRTRIAEVRTHPHGGPPGQLKKDLGLQTGAEVVHGTRPGGRARVRTERVTPRDVPERRIVERRSGPVRKARAEKRERSEHRVTEARREPVRKVRAEKRERARTEPRVEHVKPTRAPKARMHRSGGAERTSLRENRGGGNAKGGGATKGNGGKGKGNGRGKG